MPLLKIEKVLYDRLAKKAKAKGLAVSEYIVELVDPALANRKKPHDPGLTVDYSSGIDNVIISDLPIPHGMWTLLSDLVMMDRYPNLADAIRAGIRTIVEQNAGFLLAREAAIAGRKVVEATSKA